MLIDYSIISRLLYIHEQIILKNDVNCKTISDKYEITERTIRRDICFMKNELQLPLEFCNKRKSYYYTENIYGNYWKIETLKMFLDRIENAN